MQNKTSNYLLKLKQFLKKNHKSIIFSLSFLDVLVKLMVDSISFFQLVLSF